MHLRTFMILVVFLGIMLNPDLWAKVTTVEGQYVKPKAKPNSSATAVVDPVASSVSAEIDVDQIDKFRRGRPMDEILRDIRWAGNFEMATEQDGKTLVAISFEIRPTKDWKGRFNKSLWAVFVDERFVNFVDMELVEIPSSIPVGTFPALLIAAKRESVDSSTLKKLIQTIVDNEPAADPDLTAISGRARAKNAEGLRRMEQENAQLRDQFNAARLKIGMTRAEVAVKLKAKPVESGVLESGSFEIYGSTRPVCPQSSLCYHNILALYRGDRLTGIYSGDSAPNLDRPPSLKPEEQTFIGLPPSQAKPKVDSPEAK